MRLKTKIWIENENKNLILGSGRLQILKDLMKTNNIKITAKNLNMNYRKCWGKINEIFIYIVYVTKKITFKCLFKRHLIFNTNLIFIIL